MTEQNLEKPVMVSAMIPGYMSKELDTFVSKFGQSRSELIREAIATALNRWRKESTNGEALAQGT